MKLGIVIRDAGFISSQILIYVYKPQRFQWFVRFEDQ